MPPFVIAIANRKGGTGKTTTAVNLAVGFAKRGVKTLLIDLDTQGHAGIGLGVVAAKTEPSAHDIFTHGPEALDKAIRSTSDTRLDIAPAYLQMFHPGEGVSPGLLAKAIALLDEKRNYGVIVIDTPPSLDALLVNALASAHGVVIPFLPHPLSAEGVHQFAKVFFSVRLSENPALKFVALTPVQANPNMVIHKSTIEALRLQFGAGRLTGPIRTDIKLAEAFAFHQSVFEYAPASRGAHDYGLLTEELGRNWKILM
ncbi:ParA family protein [Neorhizobium lilium]|uniref:ParA family protein n=1 Tax=Neorhizobium lilium TaxID=2503024 RepID=A0A444LL38_9HYPH|nr:ParA family protein [Neorhizobium lilium]RWX81002.1 ParA family protein [Neorhizobium lilium]